MSKEMGKIRPSQLIYHYGPGAVVDLVDDSVMVMAADLWNTFNTPKEKDERIQQALRVDHIRILNERPDSVKVRAVSFPTWKICPSCNMMTNYKNMNCYHCNKEGKEVELYPSRFIVACKNGHISDFPYLKWVHQDKPCTSDNPALKFIRKGESGSLSDLSVRCVKCYQQKPLGTIMQKGALKKILPSCTGERPWIGDKQTCQDDAGMETYLRGASNIYSPAVTSFLQIPLSEQNSDPLVEEVMESRTALLKAREKGESQFIYALVEIFGFKIEDKEKIEQILDGDYYQEVTYESLRKQEWNTLIQSNIDDSFGTGYKSGRVEIHQNMKPYFETIHRVESLPEIQVLQGFSRIEYLDRFELSEPKDLIPIMKEKNTNWLPGIKNNGEGIFFQFNEKKLREWEEKADVSKLSSETIDRYNKRREQLNYTPLAIANRHLLIHSFSHALIKELAAHSGYSTTSLKERLYCNNGMQGVLIYTASGDSEGSLGGLIAQATPEKLHPIFIRAVERMMYCSSDPNCSEGLFKFHTTANGAACHSCTFISETSCEWGNQLLDRRLLLNINPGENIGFFDI
jgi:hypothetical protein